MTAPQRTCVGCRAKADRASLVRYVLVDGAPVRDEKAVRPGRGAWVHDDPRCYELAQRRGGLGKALRRRSAGR